jgi:hypothetical protein
MVWSTWGSSMTGWELGLRVSEKRKTGSMTVR